MPNNTTDAGRHSGAKDGRRPSRGRAGKSSRRRSPGRHRGDAKSGGDAGRTRRHRSASSSIHLTSSRSASLLSTSSAASHVSAADSPARSVGNASLMSLELESVYNTYAREKVTTAKPSKRPASRSRRHARRRGRSGSPGGSDSRDSGSASGGSDRGHRRGGHHRGAGRRGVDPKRGSRNNHNRGRAGGLSDVSDVESRSYSDYTVTETVMTTEGMTSHVVPRRDARRDTSLLLEQSWAIDPLRRGDEEPMDETTLQELMLKRRIEENIGFATPYHRHKWHEAWVGNIPLHVLLRDLGEKNVVHRSNGLRYSRFFNTFNRWKPQHFVLGGSLLFFFDSDDSLALCCGAIYMPRATVEQKKIGKRMEAISIAPIVQRKPGIVKKREEFGAFFIAFDSPRMTEIWMEALKHVAEAKPRDVWAPAGAASYDYPGAQLLRANSASSPALLRHRSELAANRSASAGRPGTAEADADGVAAEGDGYARVDGGDADGEATAGGEGAGAEAVVVVEAPLGSSTQVAKKKKSKKVAVVEEPPAVEAEAEAEGVGWYSEGGADAGAEGGWNGEDGGGEGAAEAPMEIHPTSSKAAPATAEVKAEQQVIEELKYHRSHVEVKADDIKERIMTMVRSQPKDELTQLLLDFISNEVDDARALWQLMHTMDDLKLQLAQRRLEGLAGADRAATSSAPALDLLDVVPSPKHRSSRSQRGPASQVSRRNGSKPAIVLESDEDDDLELFLRQKGLTPVGKGAVPSKRSSRHRRARTPPRRKGSRSRSPMTGSKPARRHSTQRGEAPGTTAVVDGPSTSLCKDVFDDVASPSEWEKRMERRRLMQEETENLLAELPSFQPLSA